MAKNYNTFQPPQGCTNTALYIQYTVYSIKENQNCKKLKFSQRKYTVYKKIKIVINKNTAREIYSVKKKIKIVINKNTARENITN